MAVPTVVKTSTNWIGKACANLTYKMPFHFNIIGWGRNGLFSPKHHSVSQQTVCLVPSLGYPTLVRLLLGDIARADPGHQEHSKAAVLESREPPPRPTATCYCYGHLPRPGSPLRAGAPGLALEALVSLPAPSRLLLSSSFGWWSEGGARPPRAQPSSAGPRVVLRAPVGHKAPRCRTRLVPRAAPPRSPTNTYPNHPASSQPPPRPPPPPYGMPANVCLKEALCAALQSW